VGGMFEEDEDRDADVEVGRINDQSIIQSKPIVPFINTKDPSLMESGIFKPVTPISKSKSTGFAVRYGNFTYKSQIFDRINFS
jgi:hypothetical protein